MLPRVTITPDLSGRTVHSAKHFSKPASDHNRSSRKPVRAAFVPTSSSRQSATKVLTNATPTRRSFEKPPLEPGAPAPGIQSCLLEADSAGSAPDVEQQALSDATISQHSSSTSTPASSATSLHKSDSELALLLNGADLSRPGTTTINIGSIPIQVPLACIEVPSAECSEHIPAAAHEQQQQRPAASAVASESRARQSDESKAAAAAERTSSKLKATSAEFYPPTYLAAAAAATALASAAVASSSSSSGAELPGSPTAAAVDAAQQQHQDESLPEQQQQQQQQGYWQAVDPSQWQQQQQWQQWQQQQQPMPMPVPMFFPVPVPIPPYLMPAYPYAYHQATQHQQHLQVHPIMLHHQQQQQQQLTAAAQAAEDNIPTTPAAASAAGSRYTAVSPEPSLPADTASLMSTPTAAAARWAMAHGSSLYGGSSSSRPGSSASSVASGYTGIGSRQQQQVLRDAGTVTVSALSSVKDAAGALAKVVSRHGSCLLLSLSRPGDQSALSTHVAAKSLAVARFYVNAHMAAAGAAGVDAAAVLTGLEPPAPSAAAAVAAADDEVVFMPYHRSASSSRAAAAAAPADAEPALGFIVAKANAKDLPVVLPPPVGIPACMQDKQQQQDGSSSSSTVATASTSTAAAAAPLLKAGANTDVNKLSNAIIHNILGSNHVALQLAGAAACHVAMKALIKARARLQRKFHADIVATASFANEDTSNSIGRSTVFLRLDVMRSSLLQQLSAVGSAVASAIEGSSAVSVAQQQYAPAM